MRAGQRVQESIMNVHASALAEAHLPDEQTTAFAREAIEDLSQQPKKLSPKYFYDAAGSELFEAITRLPEYYPTRTELAILKERGGEISRIIPEHAALVEFGAGATTKVRLLLNHCKFAAYVPVDISGDFLTAQANGLKRDFPSLGIYPVAADFTTPFELPKAVATMPKVGFFPGSTIGNFEPHEACAFLRNAGRILGPGATLIVGADLIKPTEILNAAYSDKAGVTAKFNLNLLVRINRELRGTFKLDTFEHHAFYNGERHRVEMHLASLKRQKVKVAGETIEFRAGETIHTENSYKYSIASLGALARGAGWQPAGAWTDARDYFSIQAFTLAS
jgi:L-histidine Nalpha-methyltransferase